MRCAVNTPSSVFVETALLINSIIPITFAHKYIIIGKSACADFPVVTKPSSQYTSVACITVAIIYLALTSLFYKRNASIYMDVNHVDTDMVYTLIFT